MILEEYREFLPSFRRVREIVLAELQRIVDEAGLFISGIEGRVKTEESLAGKLELKGGKYRTLSCAKSINAAGFIRNLASTS